jgi:DNA-binding transcriptional MerR regulator
MQSVKDSRLRIGELAELAATTPRAIRHYHQLGLLAEPERDESGYRRYGPQHLIRLVRIRRLRSLGMPLGRIAASVGTESIDVDIAPALRSLADEIQQEIERLADLRIRVLDIATSGSLADPAATWGEHFGGTASSTSPSSCRPPGRPPRNWSTPYTRKGSRG